MYVCICIVHIDIWSLSVVFQDIIQSSPNSQESTLYGVCSLQLAINFLFHTYLKTKKKLRLDQLSSIHSQITYQCFLYALFSLTMNSIFIFMLSFIKHTFTPYM